MPKNMFPSYSEISNRFVLISFTLVVLGCSNLKPVQDFGSASSAFATSATDAYTKFDDELSRTRYVTAALDKAELTPAEFDGFMETNDRRLVREKALAAIGKYAQALDALASKDFRADIAGAITEFDTNLNSLGASYTKLSGKNWPISKSDAAILSTVVKVAADAYVEHKRKEAIRALVPKTNAAIQSACGVLASEFENFGSVLKGFYVQEQDQLLDRFNEKRASMSPNELLSSGDMIKVLHDRINQVEPFYSSVASAAAKVAQAHASLTTAVGTHEFTTKQFIADVKVLIAYAKEVQSFQDKLK